MSDHVKVSENQYVLFKLENESYGLDILQVETIEKIIDITRVPNASSYVEGVINLRGEVVPVINLRKRFDFPQAEITDETRIIIVSIEDMIVGLLVDSSSEVLQLSSEEIEDVPKITGNLENDFVKRIGKKDNRIIMILDLKKVLGISGSKEEL